MINEVEWFCYLGAENQFFDRDTIIQLMQISHADVDLMTFAQAVIDNGLATVESVQQLLEHATYYANESGPCPHSLLGSGGAAAPTQQASAQQAAPPRDPNSAYPFSTQDFPDLSQAADLPMEECKELMIQFLQAARRNGSSDAHLSADAYPFVRHFGINYLLREQAIMTPDMAKKLNLSLLSEKDLKAFEEVGDLDYCYSFSKTERYRSNLMVHNDGVEGSYRIVSEGIKTLAELGFQDPTVLEKLTTYHQGLILITGPASSGKTTTLAAMVDLINKNRKDHIITVEDPVEILIPSKDCNVSQRELHTGTKSFANALKAALREDPDIIILGEMRDLETIEMGLSAAETGHLVIGTLHTNSASSTLDRILDVFPPDQQSQIRAMVAESLRGVICQYLVPNKDETGLLMAPEILIGNIAVANLIKDNKTSQLTSVIEVGKKQGMVLKEDSFLRLYHEGKISAEAALPHIVSDSKRREIQG